MRDVSKLVSIDVSRAVSRSHVSNAHRVLARRCVYYGLPEHVASTYDEHGCVTFVGRQAYAAQHGRRLPLSTDRRT